MGVVLSTEAAQAVCWLYALTSLVRVLAYVPQVRLVWRCVDGARSVSLLTWVSSAGHHLAAMLYALLVLEDNGLMVVAAGNMVGSAAIVCGGMPTPRS